LPKEPLSNTLTQLILINNSIYVLPPNLPDSLQILNMCNNKLCQLPSILPKELKLLCLAGNNIQYLPHRLPKQLTTLTIDKNNLQCFPDDLPNTLFYFSYEDNPIINHLYPLLPDINIVKQKITYINDVNSELRIKNRNISLNSNFGLIEKAVRFQCRPENINNLFSYAENTDYYKDKTELDRLYILDISF
jgi:hypothetical protein